MAGEIVHLEIPSRSFDRSAVFYAKLFGWRTGAAQSGGHLLFEIPGGGAPNPGGDQTPGGVTGSLVRSVLAQATGPLPFIAVDDIDENLAEAERQGGRVLVPRITLAGQAQYGLLADLDGNVLAVVSGSKPANGTTKDGPRPATIPEPRRQVAPAKAAKGAPPAKAVPAKAAAPSTAVGSGRPGKAAARPPASRKR